MRRLQRGPAMLFLTILMVSVFLTGYYHLPKTTVKNHQVEKKSLSYEVLKEDVDLAAHYYKSVGKKSDSSYKRVTFTIKKNEKVLGYNIGKTQSFSKYLKLVGPKSKDMIGKVEATKVAYTLVLSGDLVQVIDNKTNQSYTLIDNAFVPDYRSAFLQSILLAKATGVGEKDILKSKDDIDSFFLD